MRGVLISGVFLSSVISGTPLIPVRAGIWRGSHKQMPLISKAGGMITIEDNDVYPALLSIDLLQNIKLSSSAVTQRQCVCDQAWDQLGLDLHLTSMEKRP